MSSKHNKSKKIGKYTDNQNPIIPNRNIVTKEISAENGWTSINQGVYQGLLDNNFCPALYYTPTDPAKGKNGVGYTESDETVSEKKHNREEFPYG